MVAFCIFTFSERLSLWNCPCNRSATSKAMVGPADKTDHSSIQYSQHWELWVTEAPSPRLLTQPKSAARPSLPVPTWALLLLPTASPQVTLSQVLSCSRGPKPDKKHGPKKYFSYIVYRNRLFCTCLADHNAYAITCMTITTIQQCVSSVFYSIDFQPSSWDCYQYLELSKQLRKSIRLQNPVFSFSAEKQESGRKENTFTHVFAHNLWLGHPLSQLLRSKYEELQNPFINNSKIWIQVCLDFMCTVDPFSSVSRYGEEGEIKTADFFFQ